MPTPKRAKVNYTMTEALLPEMSSQHIGEFYVAKAEQTVWFVAANGALVSLTDLLQNAQPVAPPRHGRDGKDAVCCCKNGKDGASIIGPKGDKGDCGESITGAPGRDGRDGKVCVCVNIDGDRRLSRVETSFTELRSIITNVAGKSDAASTATLALLDSKLTAAHQAVTELAAKSTNFATAQSVADRKTEHQQLKQTVADLSATVQGLLAANRRSAEYVEFLKSKVAGAKS